MGASQASDASSILASRTISPNKNNSLSKMRLSSLGGISRVGLTVAQLNQTSFFKDTRL